MIRRRHEAAAGAQQRYRGPGHDNNGARNKASRGRASDGRALEFDVEIILNSADRSLLNTGIGKEGSLGYAGTDLRLMRGSLHVAGRPLGGCFLQPLVAQEVAYPDAIHGSFTE